MNASVESYLSIVQKAHDGRIKLPAFQRDWKWRTNQVTLLFDSLRQGFPIGGFLFIKKSGAVDLAPRAFRGSNPKGDSAETENLVLDGQQRITAGLQLFFGQDSPTHYFLDLNRLFNLHIERKVDLDSNASIREFLHDLDGEDNYCVARKSSKDPDSLLISKQLLWTSRLLDEDETKRSLERYKSEFPNRSKFADYVIGSKFRPSEKAQIPITIIDGDITVEAVSRIFSTLNSTGKLLTPFELVVSILFPNGIRLQADVDAARERYPYYGRLDANGDIFLQTVALFANKDTKKAALPKTIQPEIYRTYSEGAFKYLNEAGKLMTELVGLGLDVTSDLLVYPVIFPPMAYVLQRLDSMPLSVEKRAKANRKLAQWFIGAILDRRYQQSTHDKQKRDRYEILEWIESGDDHKPDWLKTVTIPANISDKAPDSAIGKLILCILNHQSLKDPYSKKSVGYRQGAQTTARHHIFPTKYVKQLHDWTDRDDNNVALNIMLVSQETNAAWFNMDPAAQFNLATDTSNRLEIEGIYSNHLMNSEAVSALTRSNKSKQDFFDFLAAREQSIVEALGNFGFSRAAIIEAIDADEIQDD